MTYHRVGNRVTRRVPHVEQKLITLHVALHNDMRSKYQDQNTVSKKGYGCKCTI